MTAVLEVSGKAMGGSMPPRAEERLRNALKKLEGRQVRLTLEEVKKKRSTNQNAYYWGVCVARIAEMFRDAGNYVDADDVHEFLKLHVGKLSRVLVTPEGEVLKTLGSTRRLSTQEFEVYLHHVREWAAQFGCIIPLPNESTTEGEA